MLAMLAGCGRLNKSLVNLCCLMCVVDVINECGGCGWVR